MDTLEEIKSKLIAPSLFVFKQVLAELERQQDECDYDINEDLIRKLRAHILEGEELLKRCEQG